ncbi:EamA family transporter [Agarivorans sp.]|uniref:EamA family transporter n=1 Tax=Agarivorans sp. TaxID=1872412 RepID=UPI003D07D4C6
MDAKSTLAALLVVFIWGLNFSVIKFGLEELPPIMFSGLRFLIVAVPAVFFVPFPRTSVWNVLGVGVFLGVLKFSFLFVAMRQDISAGLASLLLQAQVVFTILLSLLFFREKLTARQLVGAVIALAGFSFFFQDTGGNATSLGLLLVLSAALFWAISNLIMKRVANSNLLHFMVWASLVPPLPLFLVSYFFETKQPLALLMATTAQSWGALVYVSYISTLLAFSLWAWLLRHHQTAVVTPFALLIPIVGMLGSSILLGERLTQFEVFGGMLVLLGLAVLLLTPAVIVKLSRRIGHSRAEL